MNKRRVRQRVLGRSLILLLLCSPASAGSVEIVGDAVTFDGQQARVDGYVFRLLEEPPVVRETWPPVSDAGAGGWGRVVSGVPAPLDMLEPPFDYRVDYVTDGARLLRRA